MKYLTHIIFFPLALLYACGTIQNDAPEIQKIGTDATQEIITDVINELAKRKTTKSAPSQPTNQPATQVAK